MPIDTEALDQAVRKRINRPFWRSIPEEYWGKELRRNPMTKAIWIGEYRRILDQRRYQNAHGRGDTDLTAIF